MVHSTKLVNLSSGGVAVDETRGRLYIADYSNDCVVLVQLYDGLVEAVWGSRGSEPHQFQSPCSLAYCPVTDQLYVADSDNHCVKVLRGVDGQCVQVIGTGQQGKGETQMSSPQGVAVDNDQIYVADTGNHRVLVFGKHDGAFRFVMHMISMKSPAVVSVDSEAGVVYVASFVDHDYMGVFRSSNGRFLRKIEVLRGDEDNQIITKPCGVMCDSVNGVLYVTSYDSATVCARPAIEP
eukprot:TRINITY_DN6061_c0_g4_i1.p1 TRINITY_DN6061_c0_g4~~TRINITY_DN6061_c0_g4_i1.p1  ORF type:complete len:237 (+),score=29.79 TRINITY_DN6061_c0_g4_i1:260-970(+)